MANPRRYTQIPRYLLPRLTWNTEIKSISTSPIKTAVATHTSALRRNSSPPSRRRYSTGTSSLPPSHRLTTSISTRRQSITLSSPQRPTQPSARTLDPEGPPIRHDGVYVATFQQAKRAFSSTAIARRDHHFDTLKFVQRLKDEGFSEEQAVAMMRILSDVVEESIQNLTRTMVLREGNISPSLSLIPYKSD